MSETKLYLKIYFTEPGAMPMKILAVVNESQFFSPKNGFVDPLNYKDKHINKEDITAIRRLDKGEKIDLSLIRTVIHHSPKATV